MARVRTMMTATLRSDEMMCSAVERGGWYELVYNEATPRGWVEAERG